MEVAPAAWNRAPSGPRGALQFQVAVDSFVSKDSGQWNGELAGNRTQDPRLKRALLYQLSYELTSASTYLYSIS